MVWFLCHYWVFCFFLTFLRVHWELASVTRISFKHRMPFLKWVIWLSMSFEFCVLSFYFSLAELYLFFCLSLLFRSDWEFCREGSANSWHTLKFWCIQPLIPLAKLVNDNEGMAGSQSSARVYVLNGAIPKHKTKHKPVHIASSKDGIPCFLPVPLPTVWLIRDTELLRGSLQVWCLARAPCTNPVFLGAAAATLLWDIPALSFMMPLVLWIVPAKGDQSG